MRYQVLPRPIGWYGVTVGINPGVVIPVPTSKYLSQTVVNWAVAMGLSQFRIQINMSLLWLNQNDFWQNWSWDPLDDAVNKLNKAGLRVTFPVRGMPTWAFLNPAYQSDTQPTFMPDPLYVTMAATAVAQRYNGVYNVPGYGPLVVADIELGNEEYDQVGTPDYPVKTGTEYFGLRTSPYYEFNGIGGVLSEGHGSAGPTPAEPNRDPYWQGQVLAAAAPAVRNQWPWNTFGHIGTAAAWWIWDDNYRDWFTGLGSALQYVDYINAHIYTNQDDPINPQGPPTFANNHHSSFHTAISNCLAGATLAGYPNIHMRVTEFGWNTIQNPDCDAPTQGTRYTAVLPVMAGYAPQLEQINFFTLDSGLSPSGASLIQWNGSAYVNQPAYTSMTSFMATNPNPGAPQGVYVLMPVDFFTNPNKMIEVGQVSLDNGGITTDGSGNITAVGNITSTGNISAANVATSGIVSGSQQTGTVTTLANGNTITPGTSGGSLSLRVTAAGAITGLIIAAGTKVGQLLVIIHEGAAANTLTMAAAGTSNVAGGATVSLAGLAAHLFVWDAVTSLWYQIGPATN